ncbi:MAG: VWA domain-containing protein [Spirochaetia bacterium]|nr:VWA domain-containing protein [Spirochaetia bacterium]
MRINLKIAFLLVFFKACGIFAYPYLKIQKIRAGNYPYVSAEVSVSNLTPLENANEANFSIFENGWKVNYFKVKKTEPQKSSKNVTLLIDSSKSLNPKAFDAQIYAAGLLINGFLENDKVSVVSFDDDVKVRCGFTSSREQLTKCLREISQEGSKTVLYEALNKSLEINQQTPDARNYIVLFTDGRDEKSELKPKDIFDYAKKYPVPIFIVCTGKNVNLKDLARISHISGGEIYKSPDVESISKIYRLLGRLMDNTYQIQYISQNPVKNNKKQPVRVEIRMDYANLHDQDFFDFFIPKTTPEKFLANTVKDERFLMFISVACGLLILIMILRFFATRQSQRAASNNRELLNRDYANPEKFRQENSAIPPVRADSTKPVRRFSASIIEKEGPNTGSVFQIKWDAATIGHGNENTIVIDDPSVSYSHAKIEYKSGEYFLYDLLSESGVFLNDKKLLRPKSLHDFDEIRIGRTRLMFRKVLK